VLLVAFVCLQVMDMLTTLLFLRIGVGEANPLIRAVLRASAPPALALAAPKVLATALGLYAWRSGRKRLLRKMNLLFALCVGWNLIAITAAFAG
jgi:hypothetical protein